MRAAQDPALQSRCRLVLFGDWDILHSQSRGLGLAFRYRRLAPADLLAGTPLPERAVVHVPAAQGEIVLGRGSKAGGEAAARNIMACTEACKRGVLDAMVTAPLNKTFFQAAGYPYPGHTEFLAHLAGDVPVAMAFVAERLKVVLATIHAPLRAAIDQLSAGLIVEKLNILLREFPRMGLPCRRVAVAGVNPHAGESGLLGSEEIETVAPAIRRAQQLHPEAVIEGPVPADTVFHRAAQGEFDVVLALFHDQGLAPVKLLGFGEAVNVTLGLPFVRTSVDHGTAFDAAGKGAARHDSMLAAIRWALRLSQRTRA